MKLDCKLSVSSLFRRARELRLATVLLLASVREAFLLLAGAVPLACLMSLPLGLWGTVFAADFDSIFEQHFVVGAPYAALPWLVSDCAAAADEGPNLSISFASAPAYTISFLSSSGAKLLMETMDVEGYPFSLTVTCFPPPAVGVCVTKPSTLFILTGLPAK